MIKKCSILLIMLIITIIPPTTFAQDSDELRTPTYLEEDNVPIVSDSDLITLFSASIAVVIGIILYSARDVILRRKNRYDKGSYDSQKNRDFEKYHSDWTSDDEENTSKKGSKEDEFRRARQDSTIPDYYAVLGIPKESSQDEIKSKFRQLAKELHPDKSKDPNTEKKMADINKAYEVLSDKEQRKNYDKYFSG